MKTIIIIISICVFALSASAQTQQTPQHTPAIGKGYYSIGTNARKLATHSSGVSTEANASFPGVKKGYYSIATNNRKLGKQITIGQASQESMPVIRKGYYSIGRNSEKLK